MAKLIFDKMEASGNDFVVVSIISSLGSRSSSFEQGGSAAVGQVFSKARNFSALAKKLCHRRFGVGADGMLLLTDSRRADIRMRIFNADGSEAQMCGNGARCCALWLKYYIGRCQKSGAFELETLAGIIKTEVDEKDRVRIKLTDPFDFKLDIPLKIYGRAIRVNFVNTGVPHTVIFCSGLDDIDVLKIAPQIRYHRYFGPSGTNVNFVEVLSPTAIKLRTYERGVEDETLACGTGSVASALIFSLKADQRHSIKVHTRGKEVLTVYYKRDDTKFSDVWLEGKARFVFRGEMEI